MGILMGKAICKTYGLGEQQVKAADHMDFTVEKGEFVAVVGQSGAGKSTFMHIIGGLERPDSGEVLIDGTSLYRLPDKELAVFRRRQIGFVFQAFHLVPVLTVWENIILPLGLDGREADTAYVEDMMETLGIIDKRGRFPQALSGGQQQRVAIARAMAARPAILLADEPTGNLDSRTSGEVLDLLGRSTEKYQQTLLVITHNEMIAAAADRAIRIEDGRIA
jgi:putative ABC transport system ATP-binding protein